MTKAEFQTFTQLISAVRDELKQHTTDIVQEAMKSIGEQFEVHTADYQRTKGNHELRILRLEQSTS